MPTARWRSRRWDEASAIQKVVVMLLVSLQVSLAVSAWSDLAQRPAAEINGRKRTWALVIAVNFVGPLLYFRRGRRGRRPAPADAATSDPASSTDAA